MPRENYTNNKQCLSDLLDGHVESAEVEQILTSEDASKTWYRYNVISSVLKKQHSAYSSFDFTQSVAALIEQEPVILASPKKSAQIIPFWKKTVGGLAIAASVAFAMVFSVQMINQLPENQPAGSQFASDFEVPLEINLSPSEFNAIQVEQQKLDTIQHILEQMSRQSLGANEQLVGGEFMVQSFIVKTEPQETAFQQKIRGMKMPSEAKGEK